MRCYRSFLISKLPRCHARRFFELAGEVRNILEAAGDGNVTDAHFTFGEKLFGVRNPAVDDVVDQRTAGILLKKDGTDNRRSGIPWLQAYRDPAHRRGAIRYMLSRWQQPCPGKRLPDGFV